MIFVPSLIKHHSFFILSSLSGCTDDGLARTLEKKIWRELELNPEHLVPEQTFPAINPMVATTDDIPLC